MIFRRQIVVVSINEVVFRKFKDNGEENEELPDDILPNLSVERSDFVPEFFDDVVQGCRLVVRSEFGDVELT